VACFSTYQTVAFVSKEMLVFGINPALIRMLFIRGDFLLLKHIHSAGISQLA
jgi:hypothetical protein